MISRRLLTTMLVIAILAVTSLACSITFNLPDKVNTTTTQTLNLSEDVPANGQTSKVRLEMGAGELEISGGATKLIEGSIRYNVEKWLPTINRDSNQVEIVQGIEGSVNLPGNDVINQWNIKLGNFPIDLQVQAGAYKGTLDLSGIPITNLRVSDGASQATVKFDTLNPTKMERLTYKTGASQVDLEGLGNANTGEIVFDGGAGSYTLDLSGDLQQDLSVTLKAGLSNVRINVPENANIKVIVGGGLSNVSVGGIWTTNGDTYQRSGSGPAITVNIEMGLGNLELRVR
ncbi:MAG TPA: toast rack family protein [Longilinea sp.]|nr:toast rack family protein [Longilinea sp.]